MGGLPSPGIKPMSPASAGSLFATEPPRKPAISIWVDLFPLLWANLGLQAAGERKRWRWVLGHMAASGTQRKAQVAGYTESASLLFWSKLGSSMKELLLTIFLWKKQRRSQPVKMCPVYRRYLTYLRNKTALMVTLYTNKHINLSSPKNH